MGTKLGHSGLSLGCDARQQLRLVAAAGRRGVKEVFHLFRIDHILGFYRIYSFPWRPKHNQEMLPLVAGEDTGSTRRKRPAIRGTQRQLVGKCRGQPARGRRIFARGARRIRCDPRGRRRPGHHPGLRAAEPSRVRHRRLQDSAVGNDDNRMLIPGDKSSVFPSPLSRRTITNRFALCGKRHSRFRTPRPDNERA